MSACLADVAGGVYSLAEFSRADVAQAAGVVERYSDLRIGLADASIVVSRRQVRHDQGADP